MLPQDHSYNCTPGHLEKTAIERFRTIVGFLPQECRIFREPWDCSTVLCIDCQKCPHWSVKIQQQTHYLLAISQELGLANTISFRLGYKVLGWKSA